MKAHRSLVQLAPGRRASAHRSITESPIPQGQAREKREDTAMAVEFHDHQDGSSHAYFQEWRRLHPGGYFLTFTAKRQVRLHAALCLHVGSVDWTYDQVGHSLTRKRKVCEETEAALLEWAAGAGVIVSRCADCLRGEPAPRIRDFSAPAGRAGVEDDSRQVARPRKNVTRSQDKLTAFSWGYWGWGNAVPQFLAAAAAAEAARGFKPPVFADVRLRRSVRAPGFDGTAFEKAVGQDRYRWFDGLGNARIATHEEGVEIAKPGEANHLLDFILEQAAARRRVVFFCACPTNQLLPCHRHKVTRLLLKVARARNVDLTVVEWPGGEPDCRDVPLDPTQWKQAGGATIPLGMSLPKDGLATLPWGSTVVIRSGTDARAILTGPAFFLKGQWRLPKFEIADPDDRTGRSLEQSAREFREQYSCNERHS